MNGPHAAPSNGALASYFTIVIAAIVTGVIGFFVAYAQLNQQPIAQVISPRAALTALLCGLGLWVTVRGAAWLRILIGVALTLAAGYSIAVGLSQYSFFPSFETPFAKPAVNWPIAFLYAFVGVCVSFGISANKRRVLWRVSGAILVVVGTILSLLCWVNEGYHWSAPHPVLAGLASLFVILLGVALWLGSRFTEGRQTLPSFRALAMASVGVTIIAFIWFLLSSDMVSRIEAQGVRAVQEAAKAREEGSFENYRLVQRLVNRWQNASDEDLERLMEMDTLSYLNDLQQIDSILFLSPERELLWEETRPESPSLQHLTDSQEITSWLATTQRQAAFYIPTESIIEMSEPKIVLKIPVFRYTGAQANANGHHFGYVIVVFDFARSVDPSQHEIVSPFRTYARVQLGYLLNSQGSYTEIRRQSDFSDSQLFAFQRMMRLPLGMQLPLQGFLIDTQEVRRAANLNTLVVGGGWLLAMLLAVSLENGQTLRAQRSQLQLQATHDGLTGLINRTVMEEMIGHHARRNDEQGESLAVLFIDLDGFKPINDSLGLAIGDKLLIETAHRIEKCMRNGSVVARFGGDEFVVMVPHLGQGSPLTDLIGDILSSIAQPFLIERYRLYVTASVGITTTKESSTDPKQLIQDADMAMYQAKRQGRNHYQFYTADISERFHSSVTLRNELQHVLEQNALQLFYQPIFSAHDRKVVGVEALLRWQREDGSYVSPAEFIPLAEASGQIIPISSWVLQQACQDGVALQAYGDLAVSVNLSAIQFHRANFIESMKHTLNLTGFDASKLHLELTESILLEDSRQAIRTLEALRRQNFSIAIDDFGTGFSSLSYLKQLPVDSLKIDRSFIADVIGGEHDAAIASGIISMAKQLKLQVVAEGVETEEQAAFVEAAGCHLMQGFYFAKPMPYSELVLFLERYSKTNQA